MATQPPQVDAQAVIDRLGDKIAKDAIDHAITEARLNEALEELAQLKGDAS